MCAHAEPLGITLGPGHPVSMQGGAARAVVSGEGTGCVLLVPRGCAAGSHAPMVLESGSHLGVALGPTAEARTALG